MNLFTYYFQRARHLCVYQYSKVNPLPPTLIFPYVTTITLIDSTPLGISHLLCCKRFPKLQHIQYLSGHPGSYDIHERFPTSVKWIFPNYDYAFYNCMLEAGHGIKSNTLINEMIYSKSIKNNVLSFDIHIPGYGRRDGLLYRQHMYDYFHKPEVLFTLSEKDLLPESDNKRYRQYIKSHENSSLHNYERLCLEHDVMNHILKDV